MTDVGPYVPRRVLMTADAVGGVFTYALELARALAAHGVETVLATAGPEPSPAQRAAARAVPRLRLVTAPLRLEWMDGGCEDAEEVAAWLKRLEREVQPDVVHLNGFSQGDAAFHAPSLLVAHSDVVSWWKAVRGGRPPASWDRYRALVAAAAAAAQVVAAPTRAMLSAFEEEYGPLAHAVVVPNGRDPSLFVPGDARDPLAVASGRLWDEAKDFALLDRVAAHVAWPVTVAGAERGPDGQRFAARAVSLAGALETDALASLLSRASIFVSTARYEPFGLGPLEAGLARCALVLSDIPSLREVWGDAALFVPPGDERAFAATLQALIEAPLLRAHLGRRARLRALQYGPARMLRATLRAYHAASSRFPAPARVALEAEPRAAAS